MGVGDDKAARPTQGKRDTMVNGEAYSGEFNGKLNLLGLD